MKTMVLLYDTSCIYEIVILNYFLNATGKEMIFVSPEGNPVMATEGYRIEAVGSRKSGRCGTVDYSGRRYYADRYSGGMGIFEKCSRF